MIIAGKYSFNNGERVIVEKYPLLLAEVRMIIDAVKAEDHITKESKEKTMPGKMLYNPSALNKTFKKHFTKFGWEKRRVKCEYSSEYYTEEYDPPNHSRNPYREMDFIKNKLGVEVQFGKYAFMVYNVAAKMTIFSNLGHIDAGIEMVPVKQLAAQMSTGVSYFEQFVWDLEHRGISNIDIPVLILGIDSELRRKR